MVEGGSSRPPEIEGVQMQMVYLSPNIKADGTFLVLAPGRPRVRKFFLTPFLFPAFEYRVKLLHEDAVSAQVLEGTVHDGAPAPWDDLDATLSACDVIGTIPKQRVKFILDCLDHPHSL